MGCNCGHCHNDHEHKHEHEHHHEHDHGHCHCHDHGHSHGHDHGHDHGGEEANRKVMILRLAISAVLLVLGAAIPAAEWVKAVIFVLAMLAAGYDVIWGAVKNILHGELFDETFLMTLAAIGAFAMGEMAEGAVVMLLFQVGELFQDYAVDKSRDSISDLMDIRPDVAYVEIGGKVIAKKPEEVAIGDVIVVKPGEKVALDGEVIEGASALNTVALTGESVPRNVGVGDQVLSGCVNQQGALRVQVTHAYADSTVARILELVENASENKSKADKFITRFARVYTPVVVVAAALVAVVPSLITGQWAQWIQRALNFLVISCPCALVISVPLSFFSGIGGASRRGILVKGSNYLELLAKPAAVAFDKTGTLTAGSFSVTAVHPQQMEEQRLLALAAAAEKLSTHPIAASLREAAKQMNLSADHIVEVAGQGVCAQVDGHRVAVGNEKLMTQEGADWKKCHKTGTIVHVAVDGVYAGHIVISDVIKPGAHSAISGLHALGVKKCVMLTGDSAAAAEQVAREVGVDQVHAQLLPGDKVAQVETLLKESAGKGALVFVGDGINDAPVLARADVGVAMGALGSDAAIEAADVVLMDDDPRKLCDAVRIARKTERIVKENIVFSLAVKVGVMVLSTLGLTSLWAAVFADVGVCFLAILNAIRCGRADRK